jgi:hypothetical protein
MSSLTLNLPTATEKKLEHKARMQGLSLESYVQELLEADAHGRNGSVPSSRIEPHEFERLLDALCAGLPPMPTLPVDFTRADMYC